MRNPVTAVDEAVLARLRDAIAAEDVEEEQLKGVLRMLGEEIREQNQLHLFKGGLAAEHQAVAGWRKRDVRSEPTHRGAMRR